MMANNRNDDELLQLQQQQLVDELQGTTVTAGTLDSSSQQQRPLHPAIALGIGGFVIVNVGLLFSLPPVLMGRGAPFLPTYKSKMDQMFAPLKAYYHQRHASAGTINNGNKTINSNLTFVDLGSGDGRVVFRAAREGLFHKSIGYEINPCELWTVLARFCRLSCCSLRLHIILDTSATFCVCACIYYKNSACVCSRTPAIPCEHY